MNRIFPKIEIIRVSDAILHEEVDSKRLVRIEEAFKAHREVMRHPVIVSRLPNNKYVVLDGANRVTAFRNLGIPHIVAQIVDYKPSKVRLLTWNHLICDPKFTDIFPKRSISFRRGQIAKMLAFAHKYKGKFRLLRVMDNKFSTSRKQHKDATCLVVFPKFRPSDIIYFSLHNQKIPAGITRHIIEGRALGVNVPVRILRSKNPTAWKNKWLQTRLNELIDENRIRYYAESVYIFNE